jgi:hypothetical protein
MMKQGLYWSPPAKADGLSLGIALLETITRVRYQWTHLGEEPFHEIASENA